MIALEEAARAAGKGKLGPEEEVAKHVRDVKWTVEQPRHLLDSLKGKANEGMYQLRDLYMYSIIFCYIVYIMYTFKIRLTSCIRYSTALNKRQVSVVNDIVVIRRL